MPEARTAEDVAHLQTALACTRYGPTRVLGDHERASTAGGFHAVSAGVCGCYRHHLLSLPEAVDLELRYGPCVRVLLGVVQLLRRGRHAQSGHSAGILRLILLADVSGYRDGAEYPDNHEDRIIAKLQTQGSSDFVRCSRKTVFGEYN